MARLLVGTVRVAALAAAVAAASHALALTYPGAAPCNTTLQACVTGAAAGDTIEIATNTPIAEVVDIDKSLTIQAAAGFAPQVQFLFAGVTSVSKTVTIRGMAGGGAVRGFLGPGGGSLVLNVVGNTLTAGSNAAIGIDTNFVAGTYGTVTLVATDNVLTATGGQFGCAGAIVVGVAAPTTFDATIARNRMTLTDLSQCGGIEVLTSGTAGGTVTAEANDIRGSNFDFGIVVRPTGTGALDATIVDNLVVGQNGNTGSPGGIVLYAGGDNTPLTAAVVNNTVANGRTGIFVGARTDLGATIDGVIANNVLAFNTSYDMGIDPGIAITNDHNLVTSTGGYGFDVGPDTLVGDPRFIDAAGGDFHLARNSPGVDSGRDSALDASFTTDLDGAPRRNGQIDRGAYETAGPGNPIPADAPLALVIAALTIAGLGIRRLASARSR